MSGGFVSSDFLSLHLFLDLSEAIMKDRLQGRSTVNPLASGNQSLITRNEKKLFVVPKSQKVLHAMVPGVTFISFYFTLYLD